MNSPRRTALAFVILAVVVPAGVEGSSPVLWEHPPRSGVLGVGKETGVGGARDGDHTLGLSISGAGALSLTAPVREIFPAESKFAAPQILWTVAPGADGDLFLGAGNTGEIIRVDRKGTASLYAGTEDLAVRALAAGPSGDLFAATFPAGGVYRITAGGKLKPYFDPEQRYIWAMAAGSNGLFLATGESGMVYKVTGEAQGSVFFDSAEAHITTLAMPPSGRLLAGTDPGGLLYQIGADGKAEVLLDSDLREVSAIAVTPEGVIYAAAISEEPSAPAPKTGGRSDLTIDVSPTSDGGILEAPSDLPRKITIDLSELLPAPPLPAEGTTGRLYRIEPGSPPSLLWKSDTERIYALAISPERGLLFGTGGAGTEGRLYQLERDGSATLITRFREPQVTSLAAGADGRVYACTSNPGRLYVVDRGTASSGAYSSSVFDAGRRARWGAIAWDAETPPGTRIELTTRSGNRPAPDETWSAWSAPYTVQRGAAIASPSARYLQWKTELSHLKSDAAPVLRRVTVSCLPENRKPAVGGVDVLPRGRSWMRLAVQDDRGSPATGEARTEKSPPEKMEPPKEARWIVWTSSDPDADILDHTVSLIGTSGASSGLERTLGEGIRTPPFALLDADLPEGAYRIKITVEDGPTNGPERALGDSAESDTFLIDRAAPDLQTRPPAGAVPRPGRLIAEVTASDTLSPIARGEYTVEGGEGAETWIDLPCRDGICDTTAESFLIDVKDPAPGRRIKVRVYDAAGNMSEAGLASTERKGG